MVVGGSPGEQRPAAGPALIILAAGIGRRYGGLKQITPVGPSGEVILEYSVFDALAAGFRHLVFVVGEEIEDGLRSRMAAALLNACQVDYVLQTFSPLPLGVPTPAGRRKPWGTGHAVLICRDHIHTPFGVINADDFYGRRSFTALAAHLSGANDAAGLLDLSMVGFLLENTLTEHGQVSRGVCVVDRESFLVEVKERLRIEKRLGEVGFVDEEGRWTLIPPGSLASMNMWGFTPGVFRELHDGFAEFFGGGGDLVKAEFLLPEAVNQMLVRRRARVKVLSTAETWHGLTYQADLARTRERILEMVEAGVYPRQLWG